jgi:hypothetical protein
MSRDTSQETWQELGVDVLTGMREWRQQHPKATWREIEAALDERLNRLRAQMLQDLAQESDAAHWSQSPEKQQAPAVQRVEHRWSHAAPTSDGYRRAAGVRSK